MNEQLNVHEQVNNRDNKFQHMFGLGKDAIVLKGARKRLKETKFLSDPDHD